MIGAARTRLLHIARGYHIILSLEELHDRLLFFTMSANVRFALADTAIDVSSSPNSAAAGKAGGGAVKTQLILPYDVLVNLQGRRVTVFLATEEDELEGVLRTVDTDQGDMCLEKVIHYRWLADNDATEADGDEKLQSCHGGGSRRLLRRFESCIINSRYISLITPTVFGSP